MRRIAPLIFAVSLAATAPCALAQDSQLSTPQISSRALDATAAPTTLEALPRPGRSPPSTPWWSRAQHLATQVGVDILKHGGNAVDAAVAVGYALAVVHPCCGNIGGGGFMVVHLARTARNCSWTSARRPR